jgi:lysophospholipase L1-like esterase
MNAAPPPPVVEPVLDRYHALPTMQLSRRKKLLFSALTTIVLLGLAEGISFLILMRLPPSRWDYQFRLVNVLGFPALNLILRPDPWLFWRLRPNLPLTRLTGFIGPQAQLTFLVQTGPDGFRRVPGAVNARDTIVFLGDSCTFGVGVDDEETFAALVQAELKDIRCINAGVPGYSVFQGRRLLESLPLDPPPRIVVANFGFNDSSVWDHLSDAEHAEIIESAGLDWLGRSSLVRLMRMGLPGLDLGGHAQDRPKRPRLTVDEFTDEIRRMLLWCHARNTRVVLLIWPNQPQVIVAPLFGHQLAIRQIRTYQEARVVDLIRVFTESGGQGLYADVVHANAEGHAVVARTLLPILKDLLDHD